ncbi:MAG: hypothetical protein VCD33_12935 [Alphaproteobacteria bacterium]|jgi:hypothetical protein
MSDPATLIDHARYPLAESSSPRTTALIEQCRAELAERAVCVVEGLLTPESLAALAAEAEGLAPLAHHRPARRNCYIGVEDDPALGLDHPRRHFMATTLGVVADDLIPADSGLRALYMWPAFQEFLAAIMGYSALYPNEDRFQALNVIVYEPGEQSDWHFDPDNDFTVTLLLQEAERGGGFSIVPDIRSHGDENYPGVKRVMDGDESRVDHLEREAGSLVVFRGHDSLHRVATIEGARRRLVCVMCYEDRPGIVGDPKVNAAIYGPRAAAIEGLG